jgi:hypothetical protein
MPPMEAGIRHQAALEARIRQDNCHARGTVHQYVVTAHNTMQHVCKLPSLGL